MGTIIFHAASVSMNITFSSCSPFLLYLPFLNALPIKERQIFIHSSGQILICHRSPWRGQRIPLLEFQVLGRYQRII